MKLNTSELQTQFWNEGYVIINNLIPPGFITDWRIQIMANTTFIDNPELGINYVKRKFDEANLETRDSAGEYNLVSVDGRFAFNLYGLKEYYDSTANFLSLFTGLDIVESFDRQSAVTFMRYDPPAGQMVHHYDTNSLTVLLYLTDNEDGATELWPITTHRPTTLTTPDEIVGESVKILPVTGKMVIFQGRRCWHNSSPVLKGTKISSAWNYYINGDNWRPPEVSKRLYT
jgi:hypothetical protein